MNAWKPEFSAADARESLGLPDGFDSESGDRTNGSLLSLAKASGYRAKVLGPIQIIPTTFTYDGVTTWPGYWYCTPEWYGKRAHKTLMEARLWQERNM